MKLLSVVVILGVILAGISAQSATYTCTWDGSSLTADIAITVTPTTGFQYFEMWAGNEASYATAACKESPLTNTAIDALNTVTYTFTLASLECDATKDGSDVVTMTLTTMSSEGTVMDTDVKYTVACDFSSATTAATATYEATQAAATVTPTDATSAVPTAALALLDSGDAVTAAVAFKDSVKLQATMTYHTAGVLKSMTVKKCTAYANAIGGTPSLELFGTDGCGTTVGNIFVASTGFGAPVAASATTVTLTTPAFALFTFLKNNKLGDEVIWFECAVTFCANAATSPCDGQCVPAAGRRRRQADNNRNDTSDISAAVRVVLPGFYDEKRSDEISGPSINTDCDHYGYIIGLIVLGFVLLLTMGVALMFFSRIMKKQMSSKEKA